MKCEYCGKIVPRGGVCPVCGARVIGISRKDGTTDPDAKKRKNVWAILGLIFCIIPPVGLVLSFIGRHVSKRTDSGLWLSYAGIILSCMILTVLFRTMLLIPAM